MTESQRSGDGPQVAGLPDGSLTAVDRPVLRATFELEPPGSAEALVLEASLGQADGPDHVRGRVVDVDDRHATVEFPAHNWTADLTMLLSALIGEIVETAAFSRCRLIDVQLPAGWLPGPAHPPRPGVQLGAIVKPSLGLRPAEVADVAEQLALGGAGLIKDDELLGDPTWCPLEERVRAVAPRLPGEVVYAANVSGSYEGLLDRARRAVDAGAGAVMVNIGGQGLDAVRALRCAGLGVPVLAHRVGTGAATRNDRFGLTLPVLALLTRLAGAEYVLCGAFNGKLHDDDVDVAGQLDACRRRLAGDPLSATPLLGGGVGPHNAAALARRAGGGVVLLCGQAVYRHPNGVAAGLRATRRAIDEAVAA